MEKMSPDQVCSFCLGTAISDRFWQHLGYAKRPKTGSLLRKFRPEWKNALEDRIFLSIVAGLTAAFYLANNWKQEDYDDVMGVYCYESPLARSAGFSDWEEMLKVFHELMWDFIEYPTHKWGDVFLKFIDLEQIQDPQLSSQLAVYSANFSSSMSNLMKDISVGSAGESPPSF